VSGIISTHRSTMSIFAPLLPARPTFQLSEPYPAHRFTLLR